MWDYFTQIQLKGFSSDHYPMIWPFIWAPLVVDATNCKLNVDKEAERTRIINIWNREAWLLETLLLLYTFMSNIWNRTFFQKCWLYPAKASPSVVLGFFLTFQDAVLRQGQLRLRHLSRHKEPGAVQQEGQSSAVLFFSFISPFAISAKGLLWGGRAPLWSHHTQTQLRTQAAVCERFHLVVFTTVGATERSSGMWRPASCTVTPPSNKPVEDFFFFFNY